MTRYTRKKSIRLQNYDYAQNGLYFVTICTKNSQHLFGNISHGKMRLNRAGEMVERIWSEIPQFYDGFVLHDFVVMPNHFHGIIEIVLTHGQRTTTGGLSLQKQLTIPEVIHRFKTLTTRKYIDGVNNDKWESFHKQLWQRSYHEHVIRSEQSYVKIVEYVQNNPLKWVDDCYYG